jgi:hypothetical protein
LKEENSGEIEKEKHKNEKQLKKKEKKAKQRRRDSRRGTVTRRNQQKEETELFPLNGGVNRPAFLISGVN